MISGFRFAGSRLKAARNDGNTNRHCEEEKLRGTKQNPETTTKTIHN